MENNMENNTQNLGNQSNNGMAIAGFVVGLVSIFLNFYGITGIIGLVLSIVGLKKSKETGKEKGLAIAGIVCSIIGIIVGIIVIIFVAVIVNEALNGANSLNSLYY